MQLMLTLGIPYMLIYVQIISPVMMLLILPVGIAATAVFMFLLVAVIDDVSSTHPKTTTDWSCTCAYFSKRTLKILK